MLSSLSRAHDTLRKNTVLTIELSAPSRSSSAAGAEACGAGVGILEAAGIGGKTYIEKRRLIGRKVGVHAEDDFHHGFRA